MKYHRIICAIALCLMTLLPVVSTANTEPFSQHEAVSDFIDMMSSKHDFDKTALIELFDQVEPREAVIKSIKKPAESKAWYQYRPIFVTEKRTKKGVAFFKKHAATLKRAEKKYGVPAEIITAILGVETYYGKHKGGYRVIDSLSTLAFNYPKRSPFFTKELEHFLLLAREEKKDPLSFIGSYAGAMGKAQFIASSYRRYAIDFDNDDKRDLINNTDDAIGSIANYLKVHGWKKDEPIATSVQTSGTKYKLILEKGIKPKTSLAEFTSHGIRIDKTVPDDIKGALIELKQKKSLEYWAGFTNFYVITRYNHSELYAMAVYQLSEAIRQNSLK